jgi:hypothetical protein
MVMRRFCKPAKRIQVPNAAPQHDAMAEWRGKRLQSAFYLGSNPSRISNITPL